VVYLPTVSATRLCRNWPSPAGGIVKLVPVTDVGGQRATQLLLRKDDRLFLPRAFV
jgi:hypothetical protein